MTLHLVPDRLSKTTVGAADELRADAHKGKLIGLAIVAQYKGGDWTTRATGWCSRNPRLTSGLVLALIDHLKDLADE